MNPRKIFLNTFDFEYEAQPVSEHDFSVLFRGMWNTAFWNKDADELQVFLIDALDSVYTS